ncbi:MAG: thiamine pyrophosphate-binding protein [Oligoflexia bacterium]|nr:thiamine pyrophosphate-binding protein [Oligoflexia bacterium]
MNIDPTKNRQIKQTNTQTILNSELIVRTFEHLGIRSAFGIPGGPLTPLYNSLCASKVISTTLCQHEGGAAYMALGRSVCRKNDNDIGLCFSTAGPGATNLMTGVAAAFEERVPIFVLTANPSTKHKGKGANQDSFETGINIVSMFSHITCKSVMLEQGHNIVGIINGLFKTAKKQKKPAHLNIPMDISYGTNVIDQDDLQTENSFVKEENSTPLNEELAVALQQFIASQRPLIFAGHGIKTSKYQIHLKDVAEFISLPVMVTCHAKGIFPEDHPLYAGVFGFACSAKSKLFLEAYKPDAILFLGTRLGEVATSGWSPLLDLPALKIHVDTDDGVFNKNYKVTYGIKTDIINVFMELLNVTSQKSHGTNISILNLLDTKFNLMKNDEVDDDLSGPLSPKTVIKLLDFHLPDDVVLFSEIGSSMAWIINQLKIREGQDFYVMLGLGSMGSGLCGAIGAKTAMPKRPVLCLMGDAATLMHGTEMFSAVNSGIPVKVFVLNDGGHGIVHHGSLMLGFDKVKARYTRRANLRAFADSLGVSAYSVSTAHEFINLPFDKIIYSDVPELVELIINPEIVAPILDRAKIIGLAEKL